MYIQQAYDSPTLLPGLNKIDLNLLVNRYVIKDYMYIKHPENLLTKPFSRFGKQLKSVILYGVSQDEVDIQPLVFPYVNLKDGLIVFDMRNFYKIEDKREGTLSRKSVWDFDYIVMLNILSGLWGVGTTEGMYHLPVCQQAFSKWIAGSLVKKFGLDLSAEVTIRIIATIYYARLFTTPAERQDEKAKLLLKYKQAFYNEELYNNVYNVCMDMETLEDFCNKIVDVTGSLRLKGLNPSTLYQVLATSWIGNTSKEHIALSLEFPPIFIAMCNAAVSSSTYRRTAIAGVLEQVAKKTELQQLTKLTETFIRENYGD